MKTALTSHLLVIKLVGYKTALRANSFYCIAVELESYSSLLLNPKLKKFGILLFFFDQALRLYVIETFKGFNIKQLLDEVFVISNNCFITHWTKKKMEVMLLLLHYNGKQHKARELDMITLRNHAPRSYMTWLPVTLSVLDMMIVQSAAWWRQRWWFEHSLYAFGQSEKR